MVKNRVNPYHINLTAQILSLLEILGRERERERGERERDRERKTRRVREKGRKGKVPEKQMFQNCMPTMNVNTL